MASKYLIELKDSVKKCMGCGVCRGNWSKKEEGMCSIFATEVGFEDSLPRGRVTVAQDILDDLVTYSGSMAESLYRCTQCAACRTLCGAFDSESGISIINVPHLVECMKADVVEEGLVPPKVRDFLENTQKYGNPYGEPADKRASWADGTGTGRYKKGNDYLLYVGCVGSYDSRSKLAARALANVLNKAGVSFGILGEDEICDGNEVLRMGERDLFQYIADENMNKFKELGINKIVCLSPHSYNAFKNEYGEQAKGITVLHYTQLVADLIKSKRLTLPKENKAKVTYHDPCFLGRYNGEYDSPRNVLSSISGLQMVEMRRSRDHSFCCGGGGGNFYTDLIGGKENSPNRIRVREAYKTGAQVLAVACPTCLSMLDDAVKAEELENKLYVKDIAELVSEAI